MKIKKIIEIVNKQLKNNNFSMVDIKIEMYQIPILILEINLYLYILSSYNYYLII
jgi:hypothetical protein